MRESDRRILEFLYNGEENEIVSTPSVIAANIGYADNTVRERVKPLRETGLIEYHDEGRGIYAIAELGRKFIENRLDEDDIDDLEIGLGSEE